jgi:hypothetical protein
LGDERTIVGERLIAHKTIFSVMNGGRHACEK